MAMQHMSEIGPLPASQGFFAFAFFLLSGNKTMQSSPFQRRPASPAQAPGNLVHAHTHTHTNSQAPHRAPRPTVAWRNRPSATDLCVPRRLRRIFLSSIWLSPRFLAPSTVAKLSPKYLSWPSPLPGDDSGSSYPGQHPRKVGCWCPGGPARWHDGTGSGCSALVP